MIVTPWTDIETTDKAAGAPATATRTMALRDNASHAREILYDPDIHAPTAAHRHRGDDSAHVGRVFPNMPNLLSQPYASEGKNWHLNGATLAPQGFAFASGGQWVSSAIGDRTRPSKALTMFGAGAHLVVSGCLISDAEVTGGGMQFGLVNGGDDGENQRAFPAGARLDVPGPMITTTWRRFWGVINTRGIQFSNSIRFCGQCSADIEPAGASVYLNICDVRVGSVLDYPVPGYVTTDEIEIFGIRFFGTGTDWGFWGDTASGAPPPLDHAIMIENAIKLRAR